MIAVKTDDMVIVEYGSTKARSLRRLAKVTDVSTASFTAVHLIDNQREEAVRYLPKQVVANLGANPPAGWVYGIMVAPLLQVDTIVDQETGSSISIVWHIPADKKMREMIVKCLEKYKAIFDLVPFSIHVKPAAGQRLGSWGHYKNSTRASVMSLHLPAFVNMDTLEETMVHEVGHGLWNLLVPPDLMGEMIDHYGKTASISRTDKTAIREVAKKFDAFEGTPWKFSQTLKKGHERRTFQKMIQWIKDVHHLTKDDLVKLREGGLQTVSYFPDHEIVTGTMVPVINQYATTKAVEFFCEGWAYYKTGKPIPSAVLATLERLETMLLESSKEVE